MRLILESEASLPDRMTAPCSIVLRENSKGEWVTHLRNHQDGGYHSGHYFHHDEFGKAFRDWEARCANLNVPARPAGL